MVVTVAAERKLKTLATDVVGLKDTILDFIPKKTSSLATALRPRCRVGQF